MNAVRDPASLAEVPIRRDEKISFERFEHTAYEAYSAKQFLDGPDDGSDLYQALAAHRLDPQTIAEIHAELPEREEPNIGMTF